MLKVGLTGGIGSGKSAAADFFAALGVPIIDTDQISRECVSPNGGLCYAALREHLGDEFFRKDKTLDRSLLRKAIFADPNLKSWLENLLHPAIRSISEERLKQIHAPYCILVIPLLVENLPNPLIDRILLIDVSVETQIKRTMARDDIPKEVAQAMISAQASREERLQHADDIVSNEGSLSDLEAQIRKLNDLYLACAENAS